MNLSENISTPVTMESDVLVAGGGVAGIAAALAAARMGKKVVLLERGFMLGGLATAGLIAIYLPLCDGFGKQVSFGIAEELLRLSVKYAHVEGYGYENWLCSDDASRRTQRDARYEVEFNPQLFAIAAEKLLIESGVKLLYGAYAVACVTQGGRISHVIIEGKSGREAIAAKSFVDASGDCDLGSFAGCPTVEFKQGNVLASWYYSSGADGYKLHTLGFADISDEEKSVQGDKVKLLSDLRYSGLDTQEISDFVAASHSSMLNDILKRRKNDAQFVPVTVPTLPQLRMTRRVEGEYTLCTDEMHRYFADSIGMVSSWRKRGPVYEVPFRTLYSSKIKNLIFAGRITSVSEGMWDLMRVIPCCAVTGQAAGTAAAMSEDFSSVDIPQLQAILKSGGVVLHENELN